MDSIANFGDRTLMPFSRNLCASEGRDEGRGKRREAKIEKKRKEKGQKERKKDKIFMDSFVT